jgi:hypothetical protein
MRSEPALRGGASGASAGRRATGAEATRAAAFARRRSCCDLASARALARKPSFTVAALLTFALGGGGTAMLGAVNGILLSPFPYPEPDVCLSRSLSRSFQTLAAMTVQARHVSPDG